MQTSHPRARQIELTVADPQRLFERFDPSPQPHLDGHIEEFIVHRAQERGPEFSLVVQIANGPIPPKDTAAWARAIRAHFAHRTAEEQVKVQALARAGRRDLAIGIVFLFLCAVLGLITVRLSPPALGLFVEQGLLILGWVALWRPVDLFLYELRPLRVQRDILSSLSKIEVLFKQGPETRSAAVAA